MKTNSQNLQDRYNQLLILCIPFFLKISFFFQILRRIWGFHVFIILGLYILLFVEQGQDFFTQFNDIRNRSIIWFYVASIWWCLQLWFGSKLVFYKLIVKPKQVYIERYIELTDKERAKELSKELDKTAVNYFRNIPRMLGFAPLVIIALALIRNTSLLTFYPIAFLFMAAVVVIAIRYRVVIWKRISGREVVARYPDNEAIVHFNKLNKETRRFAYFSALVFCSFFMGYLWFPVELGPKLGPAAVLVFAFAGWTTIVAIFNYVYSTVPYSAGLVLVCMFVGFSTCNDNNVVRKIDTANSTYLIQQRPNLNTAFFTYFKKRAAEIGKSYTGTETVIHAPVYMVAAMGGGSRSGAWVSCVLANMEDTIARIPGKEAFHNQIFGMSGASGGTLGIMVYRGLLFEKLAGTNKAGLDSMDYSYLARQVFLNDYLSGTTATLLYGEVLNSFWPVAMGQKTDRATTIEKTWECEFANTTGTSQDSNYFALGFLDATNKATQGGIYLPYIFSNTTVMGKGERAIVSDLNTTYGFLRNTDVFDYLQSDIPNSTAAMLSARFPFVSPVARLNKHNSDEYMKVADGGYYENSGTLTAMEILDSMALYLYYHPIYYKSTQIFFEPTLLIISNETQPKDEIKSLYRSGHPSELLHEVLNVPAVISGVVNGHTEQYLQSASKGLYAYTYNARTANMRIGQDAVPLGWYLSDKAVENVYNYWLFKRNAIITDIINFNKPAKLKAPTTAPLIVN